MRFWQEKSGYYKSRYYKSRRVRQRSLKKMLTILMGLQVVCIALWIALLPYPIDLSFIVNPSEYIYWRPLIAEFNQSHPTIHVSLTTREGLNIATTDDRFNAYLFDFGNDEPKYDLVYMDIMWTPPFAQYLEPLDDFINKDKEEIDFSDFMPSDIKAGYFEKAFYRVPQTADVGLLYYRKDLLESIQSFFPTTLDELEEVVKSLKAQNREIEEGYLWQGDQYEGLVTTFMEIMKGQGGYWVNDSTRDVGLSSAETVAAAERLRELIDRGISPPQVLGYQEGHTLDQFLEGNTLFLRGWPDVRKRLEEKSSEEKDLGEDNVGIRLPFSLSSTSSSNSGKGCRGGWGFGISKKSHHKKAAWEAIKYFTSKQSQEKYFKASGTFPTRTSLLSKYEEQYPQMSEIITILKDKKLSDEAFVFRPKLAAYDKASEYLQTALTDILKGNKSAQAAMAIAQEKTEKLLEEN